MQQLRLVTAGKGKCNKHEDNNRSSTPKADSSVFIDSYLHIKADHPDTILFFYDKDDTFKVFFDDIQLVERLLEIRPTSPEDSDFPFCSFPPELVPASVVKILDLNRTVAMCAQEENKVTVYSLIP